MCELSTLLRLMVAVEQLLEQVGGRSFGDRARSSAASESIDTSSLADSLLVVAAGK